MTARPWREFDRRTAITAWDTLARRASEPNPFYESWYLLPSLRALAGDHKIHVLTLEADGKLVGLLPMVRESDYYGYPLPHLRNWVHHNCFLGAPLVQRGFERLFWDALLSHCDRRKGRSLFLHLSHMPETGALHDALRNALAEDSRPAATVLREERAMLASSAAPEDYLSASLSTKKRKELRRQHRRLAELGDLQVERLNDYTDIASWTREFTELEARGWKGNAGSALSSDQRTNEIFTYAIAGAAARGRLERIALRLDGKPIAMLANFLSPPGAFSFKTAFDEDYARFSPGVLLQGENLAMLGHEQIDWVDSCAAPDHPMINHLWRERRTIARHSIGIGGRMRRAAFAALARFETGHGAGGIS
ncbi:GNAT family N-acetyltransferase [Aurantiacibacter gilvus]|uniref:GNAT family N-acetyltransferase n=1 Tax=Aurantiacibacter gilvus TaxID=3139141 RepID=A0ABU9IBH4_9SPHN